MTQKFMTCKIMNTHFCFDTTLTHKHTYKFTVLKASPKLLSTQMSNVFKTANPRQIHTIVSHNYGMKTSQIKSFFC